MEPEKVLYEGIIQKHLFEKEDQEKLFANIGNWFEIVKERIPKIGILICNRYDDPELYTKNVGTKPPESLIRLIDAIIQDAIKDPENLNRKFVKITLERTGTGYSDPDDAVYHVDTKQIQWDDRGNRIGYDVKSGPDKYLAFINRPGTLVIKRRLDSNLTNSEHNKIASLYSIDPNTGATTMSGSLEKPDVLQLQQNELYKVQVGNLIHGPPLHEDGLLIAVSLIDEMTKNIPIPVYLD
jgi:hypothetical protein